MAAGGPLSAAQCVPKGMPAVYPPLRGPIRAACGLVFELRSRRMAPGWRVFSKGKAPPDRRDACPMDPPPTHQLSPSTASHAVIVMSNMPFAGVFEASLNVPGHAFDIFTGLMQSARDCARLKDAAWQQVSLSSRTLCSILLRQIPQDHHGTEARAPLKPTLRLCGFLTRACLCLVCSAFRGNPEPTPRRRLRASYSTDFYDSWRYPRLLHELRMPSLWSVAVRGFGDDRERKMCRDSLRGRMVSSDSYGSRTHMRVYL